MPSHSPARKVNTKAAESTRFVMLLNGVSPADYMIGVVMREVEEPIERLHARTYKIDSLCDRGTRLSL
jgi:hypothetical protein